MTATGDVDATSNRPTEQNDGAHIQSHISVPPATGDVVADLNLAASLLISEGCGDDEGGIVGAIRKAIALIERLRSEQAENVSLRLAVDEQRALIEARDGENAELKKALKPFAKAWDAYGDKPSDDTTITGNGAAWLEGRLITFGDLRTARRLAGKETP